METFFSTLPKGRIRDEYLEPDLDHAIEAAKRQAAKTGRAVHIMQAVACVEPDFDQLPKKFPLKVTRIGRK